MAGPDIGFATALRGNTDIVERLGRMQFQANEADKNRALKADVEGAKAQKKALEQFEIPTGQFHRLVVPEIEKTQVEYLDRVRKLKEERPNDWQNGLSNLALEYKNKMSFYTTASKDLMAYDVQTANVDKGNMYFSKQWNKFNPVYESATDLTDLYGKLKEKGVYGDASLQIRPNGSISFTPIPDRKPIRTIEDEILRSVVTIPFATKDINKKYGYTSKTIEARPVTNNPSIYGISKAEIAMVNPEAAKVAASIEDVVDDWMSNSLGNGGVYQYADSHDLPYLLDADNNLKQESREVIKDHIMGWAKNYANPKVKSSFVKEPSNFGFGKDEPENIANPVYEPGEIASTVAGKKSYRFGELNYNFDKDPQSISVNPKNAFDNEFNPVKTTTLSNVKADGVLILAVDKNGNPLRYTDIPNDNIKNIDGSDVFIRVKSGDGYFYIKQNNYSNISNQFAKKPSEALQQKLKDMILKSTKIDTAIANKKKNPNADWNDLTTLPQ
jgi:hypothetical protein